MKIAVEGCCHGELDAIYSEIANLEAQNGYKIDALLICGDFQAMRNEADLEVMACPVKYRAMHDFHKYYTGEKVAPVLTIVIGGNHEASNYLFELYHGGWLAPNIYFLGLAGCIQLNGLRIAGSSGIFKKHDFRLGHYEKPPYDNRSMRSIYHTREFCVRKLSLLTSPDVFLSHDWPNQIDQYGDTRSLVRQKPHFREDIQKGELGSPPLMGLLRNLKPRWWFAAHMHVKFEAVVVHEKVVQVRDREAKVVKEDNPDEIKIVDDKFKDTFAAGAERSTGTKAIPTVIPVPPTNLDKVHDDPPAIIRTETNFLSLDKCLPGRRFIEVIDIPSSDPPTTTTPTTPQLYLDPEWLAITRAFQPFFSRTKHQPAFPPESEARALVATSLAWVKKNVKVDTEGRIPVVDWQRFEMIAPGPGQSKAGVQPPYYANPQTEALCRMLYVKNKISPT
ncbi:lariat debranching enzyme, C-terminal domain-containing protein [Cyathus striatus]|nr:lariat debranching enzyme, C-terminal domain-containing protein [Cyathus striatus]